MPLIEMLPPHSATGSVDSASASPTASACAACRRAGDSPSVGLGTLRLDVPHRREDLEHVDGVDLGDGPPADAQEGVAFPAPPPVLRVPPAAVEDDAMPARPWRGPTLFRADTGAGAADAWWQVLGAWLPAGSAVWGPVVHQRHQVHGAGNRRRRPRPPQPSSRRDSRRRRPP